MRHTISTARLMSGIEELPIIQKTYDLIKWYVPILNRLPKQHRFNLGDRIIARLYDLLEGLLVAQYSKEKLQQLQNLNRSLTVLRYQTKLLLEFDLMSAQRYEYVSKLINSIGQDLGGWIKQKA